MLHSASPSPFKPMAITHLCKSLRTTGSAIVNDPVQGKYDHPWFPLPDLDWQIYPEVVESKVNF